jgi:hypothetical protein
MKSVNLIQVDGKWANLALMKLSAYHKAKGDLVRLNGLNGDIVYISCIFTRNRAKALGIAEFYRALGAIVDVGGSGVNLDKKLPEEVENMQPDFELYNLDYSLGFSSRGCIRNCEPCVVPRKEGKIYEVGLGWIRHKRVKLLDNNFTASPKVKEKLRFFAQEDLEVCFTQGLDARLVTGELADLLCEVNARNNSWKRRCYYFAFDYPDLESVIEKKIALLIEHGIPAYCQAYYVLCGFNTTHEQDKHRIDFLHSRGCLAFVMKYQNPFTGKSLRDPWLDKLANWVNQRYYKVCEFKDFDKHLYREKQKVALLNSQQTKSGKP